MDAYHGVADGDWIEAGLGVAGLAMEGVGLAVDPFDTLLSYGASWLMEHLEPLKEALDWLAGDPPVIEAFATTWQNVATEIAAIRDEFAAAVESDTVAWRGPAADAYRRATAAQAEALAGVSAVASGVGTVVQLMGAVVSFVREFVRDLIADLVSRLIVYVMETVGSFGLATPVVVAQAVSLISQYAVRIADLLRKLIRTIKNVSPRIGKLIEVFEKAWDLFRRMQRFKEAKVQQFKDAALRGVDNVLGTNFAKAGRRGGPDGPDGGSGGSGGSGGGRGGTADVDGDAPGDGPPASARPRSSGGGDTTSDTGSGPAPGDAGGPRGSGRLDDPGGPGRTGSTPEGSGSGGGAPGHGGTGGRSDGPSSVHSGHNGSGGGTGTSGGSTPDSAGGGAGPRGLRAESGSGGAPGDGGSGSGGHHGSGGSGGHSGSAGTTSGGGRCRHRSDRHRAERARDDQPQPGRWRNPGGRPGAAAPHRAGRGPGRRPAGRRPGWWSGPVPVAARDSRCRYPDGRRTCRWSRRWGCTSRHRVGRDHAGRWPRSTRRTRHTRRPDHARWAGVCGRALTPRRGHPARGRRERPRWTGAEHTRLLRVSDPPQRARWFRPRPVPARR